MLYLAKASTPRPARRLGNVLVMLLLTAALVGCGTVALDATPLPGTPPPPNDVADELVEGTVSAVETTASWLDTMIDRLGQAARSDVVRVLLIIGGVILLVAGWRIYDWVILLAGFVLGAALATSLVMTSDTMTSLFVMLIGGLLGAALSIVLYQVAVFLMGAYVGILITRSVATLLALTPVTAVALLIGGLLFGLLFLGLSFQFLIVVSALLGAQMLTLGLGLNAAWTLILFVIGLVVQFILARTYRVDLRRTRRRLWWRRAAI
ncbi:MAG: DUF4203 domain-containing protein [Anaerolineae bacterium]|nr:DUF4203 domain-containing protein [Anaerolineae bacterium]